MRQEAQKLDCKTLENVMFTDESHFFVRQSQSICSKECWRKISASHVNQSVKHPQKKMFWESFTWKGVGFLVPVKGIMNTARYIDVLRRRAFPDLKRVFPDGNGIFQQD